MFISPASLRAFSQFLRSSIPKASSDHDVRAPFKTPPIPALCLDENSLSPAYFSLQSCLLSLRIIQIFLALLALYLLHSITVYLYILKIFFCYFKWVHTENKRDVCVQSAVMIWSFPDLHCKYTLLLIIFTFLDLGCSGFCGIILIFWLLTFPCFFSFPDAH